MQDLMRVVAVAALLAFSVAQASEVAPSLHPHEAKALKKDAEIGVKKLIDTYGKKAGVESPSTDGLKCLAAYVSHLVMTKSAALAKDPAQLTRFRQAAEFYHQQSLKHCDSKGGPPNDGLILIVVASQEEGAKKTNMNKVKDLWDEFKEAAGKAFGGKKIGPREVAIIVGVGSLILLKELVPSPI